MYSNLGVFIGEMNENGFAFKSGKLQYNDRVLACNGVDFTKEHTTHQIKHIFYQIAQEPLLRMAISRVVTLPEAEDNKTSADASRKSHVTSHPKTINKTVLTFDIQLYNSTVAGLGITVYGKTSTAKKVGDMGIYIRSITPGGAAAMVRESMQARRPLPICVALLYFGHLFTSDDLYLLYIFCE